MSSITNEARIKNPLIKAVREQLEHRALWMYFLNDEARQLGVAPADYAPAAIRRVGFYQGQQLVAKAKSPTLLGLRKVLFTKPAQWVFEMKIRESTEQSLYIDFYYCPLVKAWQRQGCSDQEISDLCDFAMCGDRGIAESFNAELSLPKTLAKGDACCEIRFDSRST
jgi:hypothetical protein